MLRKLLDWLGIGRVPAKERVILESENIKVVYEGIRGAIVYKNFRAPGKIFIGRRREFIGSLVVTEKRFVACGFSQRIISLPLSDPRLAKCRISAENEQLCLACDASDFGPNQSGEMEFRFFIPDAEKVAAMLIKSIRVYPR